MGGRLQKWAYRAFVLGWHSHVSDKTLFAHAHYKCGQRTLTGLTSVWVSFGEVRWHAKNISTASVSRAYRASTTPSMTIAAPCVSASPVNSNRAKSLCDEQRHENKRCPTIILSLVGAYIHLHGLTKRSDELDIGAAGVAPPPGREVVHYWLHLAQQSLRRLSWRVPAQVSRPHKGLLKAGRPGRGQQLEGKLQHRNVHQEPTQGRAAHFTHVWDLCTSRETQN